MPRLCSQSRDAATSPSKPSTVQSPARLHFPHASMRSLSQHFQYEFDAVNCREATEAHATAAGAVRTVQVALRRFALGGDPPAPSAGSVAEEADVAGTAKKPRISRNSQIDGEGGNNGTVTVELYDGCSGAPSAPLEARCAGAAKLAAVQGLRHCPGLTCAVLAYPGDDDASAAPLPPAAAGVKTTTATAPAASVASVSALIEKRLAAFCLGVQAPSHAAEWRSLLAQLSTATGVPAAQLSGRLYAGLLGGPEVAQRLRWGCFLIGDAAGKVWALDLAQAAARRAPSCVRFDTHMAQQPHSVGRRGAAYDSAPSMQAGMGVGQGTDQGTRVWVEPADQADQLDGMLLFDLQVRTPCSVRHYWRRLPE